MVDFQAIRERYPIMDIIGKDVNLWRVASTNGGEYAGPCPKCGGRDRFRVQPNKDGGLWFCRQCSPRWQDVVGYTSWLTGRSIKDTLILFQCGQFPTMPTTNTPKIKPHATKSGPPSEQWQIDLLPHLAKFSDNLRYVKANTLPAKVKRYLSGRGITQDEIVNHMIGFNPKPFDAQIAGTKTYMPAGIYIPAFGGPHLWYVKIRQGKGARDKYTMLKGSRAQNVIFNQNSLAGAQTAVIVEGEFDAILLSKYADVIGDHRVAIVSTSGATSTPKYSMLFAHCERVLIALDGDKAGEAGAAKWQELIPNCEVLKLPSGKDITDLWRDDFDLYLWLDSLVKPRVSVESGNQHYQQATLLNVPHKPKSTTYDM